MKYWIVPSRLFVPGRLMSPARLADERSKLLARKAMLEAELAAWPAKLKKIDKQIEDLGSVYVPGK